MVAAVCSDCVKAAARVVADKKDDPRGSYKSIRKIDLVSGEMATEPPFMVELDPDVAQLFVDADTVNIVLRSIGHLVNNEVNSRAAQKATKSEE